MAGMTWKDIYDNDGVDVVDEGTYRIQVASASPHQSGGRVLFLGLKVLDGPLAGKTPEVNLYLPDPQAEKFRGQMFNFRKGTAGFDISTALQQMDPDGDLSIQLQILADALQGQIATAEIGKRKEGEYAGRNELVSTKPADDVLAPASAKPVQPAAQAAPVTAPEPVVVAAPEPEPALTGEVPF